MDKDGYRMASGFAKFVRENTSHLQWLRIDTCCVNQESSQEVTEAVNSMFHWYTIAEVCLASLPDVETMDEEAGFKRSECFMRGWTLQELLASHSLLNLPNDWKLMGCKGGDGLTRSGRLCEVGQGLESVVASITGILECVLHNYTRRMGYSVEERLAWINRRKTSKGEDMSCSMFGIFDVPMPVIYGEGAKKARKRLRGEISETLSTQSVLGPQDPAGNNAHPSTQWNAGKQDIR